MDVKARDFDSSCVLGDLLLVYGLRACEMYMYTLWFAGRCVSKVQGVIERSSDEWVVENKGNNPLGFLRLSLGTMCAYLRC